MEARLHGPAASEAIRIYARLGGAQARFDGRRVREAVLTRRGRVRLSCALRATLSRLPRIVLAAARPRETSPTRRASRAYAARGSSKPRPRPRLGPAGGVRGS